MGGNLLGFEVTVGETACVGNVPVAAYLGGVRTGADPYIGDIDTVECDADRIPGVYVCAQVVRFPTVGACAIIGERSRDGGGNRTACAASA
jgi:hypothetical protein